MYNRLLTKRNYFLTLCALLVLSLVLVTIFWQKLPNRVFIPLRFDNFQQVGFYDKTMAHVSYLFITPIITLVVSKLASLMIGITDDFKTSMMITKLVDTFGYLLVSLTPLIFFTCTIFQNARLSYYFYLLGLLILVGQYLLVTVKPSK